MNAEIIDQATATTALNRVRDNLFTAAETLTTVGDEMRNLIVAVRPAGLLTVDEMAQAIERDRNYIDSVWSAYGETVRVDGRVKQTRVPVTEDTNPEDARAAYEQLSEASRNHRRVLSLVGTSRAERDRVVAMVYGSKLLGPSAIAAEVGIDRNHVLRIARKAGVAPVHRTGSKNQYSAGFPASLQS